jgi:hypothetical protein
MYSLPFGLCSLSTTAATQYESMKGQINEQKKWTLKELEITSFSLL